MHLNQPRKRALGDVMHLLAEANDGDPLRETRALPMLELLGADQYAAIPASGRTRQDRVLQRFPAPRAEAPGSDKQIARRLAVGYPTVRFHLANALRKLQADNRAALASRVQALVELRRQTTGRMAVN